jgi:KDO2-lipid IV(A) lauroyltransferase
VILAHKTGVAILPAFVHREGGRHVITVNPACIFEGANSEAGMAADVKQYSEYIERFIIAHPTNWYWVHRRWKRAGEPVR